MEFPKCADNVLTERTEDTLLKFKKFMKMTKKEKNKMNKEIKTYLDKKLKQILTYQILILILCFIAYVAVLKTTLALDSEDSDMTFFLTLSWIVASNAVCFIMHGMGIKKIYEVHNFAIGKEVRNKQDSFLIESYQNGKVSIKNKDNNLIQEISLEKLFKSYKFV